MPPLHLRPCLQLVLAITTLLALNACSPRFMVYEAVLPGAETVVDGQPTYIDSLVEVAYDYWAPRGVPYISIYNRTDSTLLLDLFASGTELLHRRNKGPQLKDFAHGLGGDQPSAGIALYYPELPILRRNGSLYLVLAPGSWQGIEGYALATASVPLREKKGAGPDQPDHQLNIRLVFEGTSATAHTILQPVEGVFRYKLTGEELDDFGLREANLGSYYFYDRHRDRDFLLQMVMPSVSTAVLISAGG